MDPLSVGHIHKLPAFPLTDGVDEQNHIPLQSQILSAPLVGFASLAIVAVSANKDDTGMFPRRIWHIEIGGNGVVFTAEVDQLFNIELFSFNCAAEFDFGDGTVRRHIETALNTGTHFLHIIFGIAAVFQGIDAFRALFIQIPQTVHGIFLEHTSIDGTLIVHKIFLSVIGCK